ncbi:hypothetical protein NDU88_000193 [Pleurodeles waltl]|uniref:Uncharacterized protein n=1 Tax=Pleurodeles waltl TaxID=8319 RepID=A0AAV7LDY0_PLEWA|nr:hypothetical protein NDU88_000193 [Pleurodeles waltl]
MRSTHNSCREITQSARSARANMYWHPEHAEHTQLMYRDHTKHTESPCMHVLARRAHTTHVQTTHQAHGAPVHTCTGTQSMQSTHHACTDNTPSTRSARAYMYWHPEHAEHTPRMYRQHTKHTERPCIHVLAPRACRAHTMHVQTSHKAHAAPVHVSTGTRCMERTRLQRPTTTQRMYTEVTQGTSSPRVCVYWHPVHSEHTCTEANNHAHRMYTEVIQGICGPRTCMYWHACTEAHDVQDMCADITQRTGTPRCMHVSGTQYMRNTRVQMPQLHMHRYHTAHTLSSVHSGPALLVLRWTFSATSSWPAVFVTTTSGTLLFGYGVTGRLLHSHV